jgi:hypothetical protein
MPSAICCQVQGWISSLSMNKTPVKERFLARWPDWMTSRRWESYNSDQGTETGNVEAGEFPLPS